MLDYCQIYTEITEQQLEIFYSFFCCRYCCHWCCCLIYYSTPAVFKSILSILMHRFRLAVWYIFPVIVTLFKNRSPFFRFAKKKKKHK